MNQKTKLLIVDDSRFIRQTISDLIKQHYTDDLIEIDTADDGDTALKMIDRFDPDIMLLDITMQRISGTDVLKALNHHGRLAIIMISSAEDDATLASCFKLGAKDFVRKPIHGVELIARIDAAIEAYQLIDNLQKVNRELLIAKNQMVQSEKMAAVGQLAAGIAHEINNPIGFISSNISTLSHYFDTWKSGDVEAFKRIEADIPELFDDLNIGISRIRVIVDSLRSFSRIDNLSAISTFDVEQGIKDTLIVARHRYHYIADVETHFGQIPEIIGNGGKLNQVFMNLIMNATDAIKIAQDIDRRKGKINIFTIHDIVEKQVVIKMTDNGVGMDDTILQSAFNPFFTTKPIGSGTGLGLSVSYDIIVNEHGGTIQVTSERGVGSVFIIKLPIGNLGGF